MNPFARVCVVDLDMDTPTSTLKYENNNRFGLERKHDVCHLEASCETNYGSKSDFSLGAHWTLSVHLFFSCFYYFRFARVTGEIVPKMQLHIESRTKRIMNRSLTTLHVFTYKTIQCSESQLFCILCGVIYHLALTLVH